MIGDMVHPSNGHKEYDEWMKGIKRLFVFFQMIDILQPLLEWRMPHPYQNGDIIEFETRHILDFLDGKLKKGYWSNGDKYFLNQMRLLYYMNRERGVKDLDTSTIGKQKDLYTYQNKRGKI